MSICHFLWQGSSWVTLYLIKVAQVDVHKCITWLKKFNKGKQAWEKAYVDYGLSPYKLNTFVNMRYVKKFHPFVFFSHVGFLCFFLFLVFFPWLICYMFKWIFSFMGIFFLGWLEINQKWCGDRLLGFEFFSGLFYCWFHSYLFPPSWTLTSWWVPQFI